MDTPLLWHIPLSGSASSKPSIIGVLAERHARHLAERAQTLQDALKPMHTDVQLRGIGNLRTDTPTGGIAGVDCDDLEDRRLEGEENAGARIARGEVWRTRQMANISVRSARRS